jgi:dipeptidyl-peptidase-4|tara:strand:- start:5180 stop:7348 length:2169 start_codon:yes stop_codon:yes gene_type:complete
MYKSLFIILFLFSTICQAQEITVEKIWKEYQFFGQNVSGFRSMKDGVHFTKRSKVGSDMCITKHEFTQPDAKGDILVNLSELKLNGKAVEIDDYEFNDDESKILFSTQTEGIYRRSFYANYLLFDLSTKKLSSLDDARSPQMLAEYSPDGKKVSYIFENNLFVKDISSEKVTQLTNDGKKNAILNGSTDWVYEEEFAITKAYGWSPDNKYIAYMRFDETEVKEFTMTYFYELYPTLYPFKYPKAGEDNSKVTAQIVTIADGTLGKLNLGEYEYIPRMKWSGNENTLILQTMNRHQNDLKYHKVSMNDGKWTSTAFYEEKSDTYIDIDDNLLILKDGKTILRTSEKDGYNHIYSLGFDGKIKPITEGKWDVIEFLGIDEINKKVYYSSAEKGAIHKGLYSIQLDGKKKKAISSETGSNDADFSVGMKYFVKTYSTANSPAVFSLCDNEGKELSILEDNAALKTKLNKYSLAKQEFTTIYGADCDLNAYVIKPVDFDPTKKYPVYFHVYGGPGSNMVKDGFGAADYMYHQLLAQKGYIVVSVDPRGTMYRGEKFKKSTYLTLGKLETEDFIAAARNFSQNKWVDKDRIGIMGWSYGGFMTSLCMTKGADVFKMGIAVAPVTNWRYYDNIYTERFMRTPAENETGYDDNSPINFVDQLKGKYLLIHGSGDDNVHYQNTMEMVNAMVAANKQFDLFVYPNKNHGIYGGNTRNHLFNMMLNYTLDNL